MAAPPDLEAVRRELVDRGYLGTAGKAGLPWWRRLLGIAVDGAAAALVVAAAAVTASGAEVWQIPLLALGLMPACLAVVALAAVGGPALGRVLLRTGVQPGVAANGLGSIAALLAAVGAATLAAGGVDRGWIGIASPTAAALAIGFAAAWRARRSLAMALAYRPAAQATSDSVARWALAGLAALAVVVALVVGRGPSLPVGDAVAFPPPSGRLAVVAVDGLSREELGAAVAQQGAPEGLVDLARWGWAPLAVGGGRLPAVEWVTVACGVTPSEHGVTELEEVRLFGADAGVPLRAVARWAVVTAWQPMGAVAIVARPALDRRTTTFWEMASRAGVPVTVGGWWGSWPVRRVLGDVASERAWLGGASGEDAVTPGLAILVREAWAGPDRAVPGGPAGELGVRLADRAAAAGGPQLLALAFPGPDLALRALPGAGPLQAARAVAPRLDTLGRILTRLRGGDFDLWVVSIPWHGGTPFVARAATSGVLAPVRDVELAPTWLDALGLPVARGAAPPRRDLSGRRGPLEAVAYGAPPPPLAAPPASSLAVQREVLRNLGYLQ